MGVGSKLITKGGNKLYVKVRHGGWSGHVALGTADPREAEIRRLQLAQAVERGEWKPPTAADNLTLDRFYDFYEPVYKNAGGRGRSASRAESWRTDSYSLRDVFKFMKRRDITKVAKVGAADVLDYREARLAEDPPPSIETVKKAVRVCHAAWEWGRVKGYAKDNPFSGLAWPVNNRPDPRVLSDFEARKVFTACATMGRPECYAAMAVALYAGPRLALVVGLEQDALRWDENYIRLPPQKNGRPVSTVFPDELKTILAPFRSTHGRLWPKLTKSALRSFVERVADASGVSFSMHDLRRTFANNLMRRGVPSTRIRDYLGHSSITTTESFYMGRHRPEFDADGATLRLGIAGPTSGSEEYPKGHSNSA